MSLPPQPTIFDFVPSTSTSAHRQPAFRNSGTSAWNNHPTNDYYLSNQFQNQIDSLTNFRRSDSNTDLLSDLPDVPSNSPSAEKSSRSPHMDLAAAAIGSGGNVLSSLVSGGFNLGSSFVHSSAQRDIATQKLGFANKQLDWQKQQWDTEWKTARDLGLSHPSQVGNPLSGGFYSLQGRTFAPSSRSTTRNIWN